MEVVSPPVLPQMNWLDLLWTDVKDNWRAIPDEAVIIAFVSRILPSYIWELRCEQPSLLGPSGSGRSTFINTAVGSQRCATSGEGPILDPVTKRTQRVYCKHDGRMFVFVDTPGLDVQDLSADHLKLSKERTVDRIVYLYPVNCTRVTTSLEKHEDLLKILGGDDWEKKTTFATTMWDQVKEEDGNRTHLQLKTKHWSQAKDKGARVDRFLGGRDDAWRLIMGICQPNTSRVRFSPFVSPPIPLPARSDLVVAEKLKTKAVSSEDIVIAVMGPTGSGKSTLLPKQFISHASRNVNDLIGHNLDIYTSKVQPVMIKTGPHKVILVDTPAFDNPNMSDMTILGMIADWLLETYNNKVKLSGIIYMHRISDNRMAGTPLKILKTFAELCGTAAAERVILVTTMWSQVKKEVGIRREAELRSRFWIDLIDKGAKVERFDASFESAWAIIGTVHQPLGQEGILLQEELANLNKQLSETRAGKTLYNTLHKQLDEEKRLLKELYDEAERHDNPTLAADLKTQYEQARRQLDVTFREVKSLEIPMGRRIAQFFNSKKRTP
ncbi:hypothetical protein EYR40_002585 [Pleurotus pulmonarius]|nr:hypothetical protein EYR40_002585 [Pleurotus pulmonarius]